MEGGTHLNLQLNCEVIYDCRGRIQGQIYLPSSSVLSEKIIMLAHRKNLHGEVA